MKQLQELAGIPSRATVRQILKGNGQVKATESLTHKLYELIRKGDLDDDGMVKKLYGKKRTPSYGPYRTLKTRLRHVLIQAVLLDEVDVPTFNTYEDAYKHGFRQLAVARILLGGGAYAAARVLSKHAFNKIKNYEIIPLNEGFTDIISTLYLGSQYDESKFLEFQQLYEYYSQALFDLGKLHSRFKIFRNKIYAHRDPPYEIGRLAGDFVEECRPIADKYLNVSQVQILFGHLDVNGCILRKDYRQAIAASERTEERVRLCKGVGKTSLSMMALTRVECTLHLKDFELGLKQIKKAYSIVDINSQNGIKLVEYAIKLGLETRNYNYSYLELAKLDRKTLNRFLTPRHIEYWRIIEAYVNFLVSAGEIQVQENYPKLPFFRLSSFINSVPSYARNKEGMNTQILILQVMFFIVERKYDKAIDRVEALERYCSRYLRKGDNFRNNCFFKLLLCVIQSNFNRNMSERKGAKILKKMISGVEVKSDVASDIEWIPYETMWEILLKNLPNDRRAIATVKPSLMVN
jgi:hypothetical protein